MDKMNQFRFVLSMKNLIDLLDWNYGDFYAGVWVHHTAEYGDCLKKVILITARLNATSAVGVTEYKNNLNIFLLSRILNYMIYLAEKALVLQRYNSGYKTRKYI